MSAVRLLAGQQTLGFLDTHGAGPRGRQRHARSADRTVCIQRELHGRRGGSEVAHLALDLLVGTGRAIVGHREIGRPAPSRPRRQRWRSCRPGNRRSATVRVPALPRTTTSARAASAVAVQSPAGSLWQRLPTTVPICRTTGSATTRETSCRRLQRRSPIHDARSISLSRAIAPTASTLPFGRR